MAALGAAGAHTAALRVRLGRFIPALAELGVAVTLLPLLSPHDSRQFYGASGLERLRVALSARRRLRSEIRRLSDAVSVSLVSRQVDLVGLMALEREAARGRALVYDIDDAIWLESSELPGRLSLRLKRNAGKVRWLATRAEHVIAGNDYLAEHVSSFASSVTVVPSCVDAAEIPVRLHDGGEAVTLGWIGSPASARHLHALIPTLERATHVLKGTVLKLLIVGAPAPPAGRLEVEAVPWSEASERDALARIDIGLMPLADTPWTRGKCAFKAVQYLAAGIPAVASPVGVASEVIGDAGFLASNDSDWLDAIAALAADPALRSRLGGCGRDHVERNYSVARWAPSIAAILRNAGSQISTGAPQ